MNSIDIVTQIDHVIGGGIVNSRGEIIRGFTIGLGFEPSSFSDGLKVTYSLTVGKLVPNIFSSKEQMYEYFLTEESRPMVFFSREELRNFIVKNGWGTV